MSEQKNNPDFEALYDELCITTHALESKIIIYEMIIRVLIGKKRLSRLKKACKRMIEECRMS